MSNAYDVIRQFESSIADYVSAPYAVAVESCSMALFLCCKYVNVAGMKEVVIPKVTYPSVPASIINAGGRVAFEDDDWQKRGYYQLRPTWIIDSAKRLERGMYCDGTFTCLSFHGKKHLKIGRGGMILTSDKNMMEWLKWMRFDGRHEAALPTDVLQGVGWNCYMSVDQAARGLEQLQWIGNGGILPRDEYQDLSKYSFYTGANR